MGFRDIRLEDILSREISPKKQSVKTSAEFLQQTEELDTGSITVEVKTEKDEIRHAMGKVYLGVQFYSLYTAFAADGRPIVEYKEEYQDAYVRARYERINDREEMELRCAQAARNRLKLTSEDVPVAITTSYGTYRRLKNGTYPELDLKVKDKKLSPLYVKAS